MGEQLFKGLRLKNEALKQGFKQDGDDPLSKLASPLSPICLNDDPGLCR